MHLMGEGPDAILSFKTFLSFINSLLVTNIQLKTSRGALFLPPSDAYVRSFLYLLYTLIKLYYTKALSDQASSTALDWILLLREPRIPASLHDSTTTFQYHLAKFGENCSTGIDGAVGIYSPEWVRGNHNGTKSATGNH